MLRLMTDMRTLMNSASHTRALLPFPRFLHNDVYAHSWTVSTLFIPPASRRPFRRAAGGVPDQLCPIQRGAVRAALLRLIRDLRTHARCCTHTRTLFNLPLCPFRILTYVRTREL